MGFLFRKGTILYIKQGVILQRDFVFPKQGYKKERGVTNEKRKRDSRPETHCGCEANFWVHINLHIGCWNVT